MKTYLGFLAAAFLATFSLGASAQHYPDRPIRLIVPFAPGGSTDFVARIAAAKMGDALGQPIVIDNRGGANGVIGTGMVARAAPDGYTLLLGAAGTLAVEPHLAKNLPFQPKKDFIPISLLGTSPFVLCVNPSVPVGNVKDLIALAKSEPGKLSFGSSGIGGAPHLATELFESMAGITMTHVPYKSVGLSVVDLLGGQIQVAFADVGLVLPYIKAGKLKALAVSTRVRSSLLPDVPTLAEAGVPGYDVTTWYGLLAPAGTPAAIISRLNAEASKSLQAQDVRDRYAPQGITATASTPAEFAAYIDAEYQKWGKVISDANISVPEGLQ